MASSQAADVHLNVQYFFITDKIKKRWGESSILPDLICLQIFLPSDFKEHYPGQDT